MRYRKLSHPLSHLNKGYSQRQNAESDQRDQNLIFSSVLVSCIFRLTLLQIVGPEVVTFSFNSLKPSSKLSAFPEAVIQLPPWLAFFLPYFGHTSLSTRQTVV